MTEDKNKHQPPPEIEVLNPRYEGRDTGNGGPCPVAVKVGR